MADVIEFFKQKSPILELIGSPTSINYRKLSLLGLKKKELPIGVFLALMLPVSFSLKKKNLARQWEFLDHEARFELANFLLPDGSIDLFGQPFFAPNYYEAIGLIKDVIVNDQYQAKKFLKEDSIIIDAGANLGAFAVIAAKQAPRGNVYAFEPAKATFSFLKKTAAGYVNVECVEKGLGDNISEKKIFIDRSSTAGNVMEDSPFFGSSQRETGEFESVSVTTLDDFVRENKIPRVDFIKIDTEGYEAKVLNGARETIKKFHPVVAMSAYHNPQDKVELPRIMKELSPDYICELHRDSEEDFICYVKPKR